MGWNSVVGIVAVVWDGWSRVHLPAMARDLSLLQKHPAGSGLH